MQIQFQFVSRCLPDVLLQLQLCQIVCGYGPLKHVFLDWIWYCEIYDNLDIRIGISDFRGDSKHAA